MHIIAASADDIPALRDQIIAVYAAALTPPPYSLTPGEVRDFAMVLPQHARRRDFRCFVAREDADSPIVGFTYGFRGAMGQYWNDIVASGMTPEMREQWLPGHFEFTELHVQPEMHGHGFGGRLHDALLEGLPHRTALLSTIQEETVALQLYRRRGWVVLLRDFMFPGRPTPYLIMGLDLEQRRGKS